MSITLELIAERFSQLLQPVRGDMKLSIEGLATPQQARPQDLIFVPDQKHLTLAQTSKAEAWVVHAKLAEKVPTHVKQVLKTNQVKLCIALIGRTFFAPRLNRMPFMDQPIHPSAIIDPTAYIAHGVLVGPNTTIGPRVQIGEHCVIGANTTIEADVEIGPHTHIHPQVYIGYQTKIGKDCEIHPQTSIGTEGFGYAHAPDGQHHRLVHFGRVVIEDRVQIGAGVQIDRGTFEDSVVGEGTIIDNQCHFGHNIKIGKGTIVAGGMLAAGSVTIGERCVFGGRTTIGGHLSIAPGSQFAGLSGVQEAIEVTGNYGGYPIQPLRNSLKTSASLAKLPEIRRNLSAVMKHLGLSSKREE
ncbi:MAG: UDP-3-O-(3-hydroxymyristoyl)glucosamine N-acyltransferase [Bdellovibrionales bacterium]